MKRRTALGLAALTAVAAGLAGCTSVPVATMWRLRSFGAEQPVSDLRLERAPADRRWFAFALSPLGLAEYQRIKREYASIPKGSHGTVKIAASDDGTVPAELKRAFPLRVDVLLDPAEGYFTLIGETRLDLSQQKKT